MKIKPNKMAFFYYKLAISFCILAILAAVIGATVYTFARDFFFLVAIFFIFLAVYYFFDRKIQFEKREYIFERDRIIMKGGGIFSNYETELVLKNITQVWLTVPFIENKFFGTGTIYIKAAGSAGDEVVFESADNPNKMYDFIQRSMQSVGFRLTRKKLLQLEKPHPLGVFFEVFRNFIAVFVFIYFFVISFIPAIFFKYILLGSIALFIFSIILTIKFILKFLDLKLREYRLYEDVIDYQEGFLTKHYSIIPAENLADSKLTQTFIDRLFGLYDIIISSQGSNNNVAFTNMINGEKFKENLDTVVDAYTPLIKTSSLSAKKEGVATLEKINSKVETAYIQGIRLFAPLFVLIPVGIIITLLLPIILPQPRWLIFLSGFLGITLLLLVSVVVCVIQKYATTYYYSSTMLSQKFSFISKKHLEFSSDKVTMIVVKRNPLDWMYNTATLLIRSIGSSEQIIFQHVTQDVKESVLKLYGISQRYTSTTYSQFTFVSMLLCNLPLTIIFTLVAIIGAFFNILIPLAVALLVGIVFVYRIYYYKRSFVRYAFDHVAFNRGLLFQEEYLAKYPNLKDTTSMKYPFTNTGKITVSAAGEIIQQNNEHKVVISNGFTMRYISNIVQEHDLFDKKLGVISTKSLLIKPRVAANTLVGVSIILIIFFPLIGFLPITLGFLYWRIKTFVYEIQKDRVVFNSGILYKSKKTIAMSRIDHLNMGEGLLNKIFKNGSVLVYTAGSSTPEMVLVNMPDYKVFYSALEKSYKN